MATTGSPTTPVHDGTAPAGALTTVFTPPAECADNEEDLYYQTRTCMPLPERWSLYWGAASFYSPGICPSGMHSVAKPPPFFGPPVEPGETAIVCCPSDYTLSSSTTDHSCIGTITVSRYSVVDVVTTITTGTASAQVKTSLTRSYYNTTTINRIFPIQVRWRESDLAILETHPLSPGVTPTAGADQGGNSDENTGGGGGGGGFSGGAIAGIVVGVVALIAVVAAAAFLMRRRRTRRGVRHEHPTVAPEAFEHKPSPGPAASVTASDSLLADGDFVPTGNASIDSDLRRVAARRARLQELERLDEEEDRLRRQASPPYELGSEHPSNGTPELGSPSR